ncbi:MAG: hypothetical protein Q7N50_14835 [Armatimonadota bacterium]|nr:hypothetical protein [Armatimonadota bacterium]
MAKQSDNLIYYGLVGGGVYLAYKMGLDGQLGTEVQKATFDIYRALTGKDYVPGLPPGITPPPTDNETPVYYREVWNLWVPYAQQIHLRICDYANFRLYVSARGLSDPGSTKPSWFCP